MKYKGYEATIEFDEEDRLFIGKVINTKDVIVFDGLSVAELEQSFQSVIDEYSADCAELGKEHNKPFSSKFNLRISPDLHPLAASQAALKGMSLNSFVEKVIQKAVS